MSNTKLENRVLLLATVVLASASFLINPSQSPSLSALPVNTTTLALPQHILLTDGPGLPPCCRIDVTPASSGALLDSQLLADGPGLPPCCRIEATADGPGLPPGGHSFEDLVATATTFHRS